MTAITARRCVGLMTRRTVARGALGIGLAAAGVLAAAGAQAEDLYGTLAWTGGSVPSAIAFAQISACREDDPGHCYTAITGTDGSFSLLGIPPGRYAVQASYDGGGGSQVVEVAPGQQTWVQLVTAN